MKQQSLSGSWQFRQSGESEWLPAQVPGGVHTDLLALGRIPDPFVADNENQVQWVAEADWEYQRIFDVDAKVGGEKKTFLVCDGLDTLAEVSLNGTLLGKVDNMFRQWRWEVSDLLKESGNELIILFRSPVNFISVRQAKRHLTGGGDIPGGPYLRKAPCQWGWDWGPKLPPIGVWKDIRLEGYSTARLEDVHIRQSHEKGAVTLSADVKAEAWDPSNLKTSLTITSPAGETQTLSADPAYVAKGLSIFNLKSTIENPSLWWPNGLGAQPLYKVEVTLKAGGKVVDTRLFQVGLRTIELRREPDEWGESFTFVVNGVPIFAKGADWIPADSFPTRLTDAHMERLIRDAAAVHMNMLRVWGGGFYEEERFYDLCDRYGILIWQDFIFACGVYPEDDEFAENVRVEAIENVRRLRHRASLALWCGNNEMEQGWVDWKWNDAENPEVQKLKAGYDRMFHRMLPQVVATEDPDHAYWPSSASSGVAFTNPNGQIRGDTHYWDVWHGRKPFLAYRQQFPRFMSEFGFQALPPYKTIQTYAEPAHQNMTSYIMEHHQRSPAGNGLMIAQMTDTFRMPRDFESLVYLSMILQAEGIRYGVEHWRRHCKRVSGTLIWQLNDCWPVASWSSIDYFGRWKALHYAAKRFYAPVMLSIEDKGTFMGVFVTNDHPQAWTGEVRWSLQTLNGKVIREGREKASVKGISTAKIGELDFTRVVKGDKKRELIFVAELWKGGKRLQTQVASFCPTKHLNLVNPELKGKVSVKGDELVIEVTARSMARFVEVSLNGADAVFSDNYFDVPAGQTVIVRCAKPEGWDEEQAQNALCLFSLYESY